MSSVACTTIFPTTTQDLLKLAPAPIPSLSALSFFLTIKIDRYGDFGDPLTFLDTTQTFYLGTEFDAAGEFYIQYNNAGNQYSNANMWTDGYTGWTTISGQSNATTYDSMYVRHGQTGIVPSASLSMVNPFTPTRTEIISPATFVSFENANFSLANFILYQRLLTDTERRSQLLAGRRPLSFASLVSWVNFINPSSCTVDLSGTGNYTLTGTPDLSAADPGLPLARD